MADIELIITDQGEGTFLILSPAPINTTDPRATGGFYVPQINGAKLIIIISPRLIEYFHFDGRGQMIAYCNRRFNAVEVATKVLNRESLEEPRQPTWSAAALLSGSFDWQKIRDNILHYRSWSSEVWVLAAIGTIVIVLSLFFLFK